MTRWSKDSGISAFTPESEISPGAPVGAGFEALFSGYDSVMAGRTSVSGQENERPYLRNVRDALNSERPADNQLFDPYAPLPGDMREVDWGYVNPASRDELLRAWRARSAADPDFAKRHGLPAGPDAMDAEIAADVRRREFEAGDVYARGTLGGKAAFFAGAMGASLRDPLVGASLSFGAGAGSGLARTMVVEGLVGAASQAVVEPFVYEYRNRLGLEYKMSEVWTGIAYAGAGGAAFGGAVQGVLMAAGKIAPWLSGPDKVRLDTALAAGDASGAARAILEMPDAALARAAANLAPDAPGLQQFQREVEHAADNPFPDSAEGRAAHDRQTAAALGAVLEADQPSPEGYGPAPAFARRLRPGTGAAAPQAAPAGLPRAPMPAPEMAAAGLQFFKPGDLLVDAKRLQFKADTGAEGVGEALKGVAQWDDIRAGDLLVWQDAAGRNFVADGHQRLALAKRLAAAGQGAPQLKAFVLRESDGFTVEQARSIAALKNIAAGSGTALDAAKVLRNAGAENLNLPPRSELVRTAQGLAALPEDAFSMVVNGLVPGNYAAIVGRLAPDPADHLALLDLLAKVAPANLTEAEAVVRQGLAAGFVRETQTSLFGDVEVSASLYRERARIVDQVLKTLRQEGRIFKTLVAEQDRIAGAGNVLARDENARRAETNAVAAAIIQKLAVTKGPVSDAITAAARDYARTGSLAGPSANVIAAIRASAASGDLHGLDAGGGRGAADGAGEIEPAPGAALASTGFGGSEPAARPSPGGYAPAGELELFSGPAGATAQTERMAARIAAAPEDVADPVLIPVQREGADGLPVEQLMTRQQIAAEIDADNKFLDLLDGCV